MKGNTQLLEIDEQLWKNQDEQLLINRLAKAASAPNIRKAMSVEDEFLSEIDARDLQQQQETIQQQQQVIRSLIPLLAANGKSAAEIAAQLSISEEEVLKAMKN